MKRTYIMYIHYRHQLVTAVQIIHREIFFHGKTIFKKHTIFSIPFYSAIISEQRYT